ncbi:copper-binding protein [Roseateles amylovorans]|uniref:Copper-binding protein n=1 Tax=Roseateles amylovorans TaxID=2978473 RepID=A0ABY6B4R4_9BURK|nr:copper-binding protein [Roseateles amylovorans]UXH79282.1 copper-binding protein [Roseateles amylovorans]
MNFTLTSPSRLLLVGLLSLPMFQTPATAQEHAHDHAPSATASASSAVGDAASAEDWIGAEIRRIDTAQQRITLKHGEIRHLDMPGMTMPFRVKPGLLSAEQLAALKPGDSVEVRIQLIQGTPMITELRSRSSR